MDFFTPIVDDPFKFGQIAVANSLSDVWAMGGVPICAMNIVAFPVGKLDISILQEVLKGGLDKMKEASVPLVGGHSISDPEMKYGLSVTGTVHPDKVLTNIGSVPGDVLVLTKPLGTGIVNTAMKAKAASSDLISRIEDNMAALNQKAAIIMLSYPVHACTDVTGFGLLGHCFEMTDLGKIGIEIDHAAIPYYKETEEFAAKGLMPGGLTRNRKHWECALDVKSGVDQFYKDIICDPQTSGGLLIAVDSNAENEIIAELKEGGVDATKIGVVTERKDKPIVLL